MRKRDRWKQISAWILASAMVLTSSPSAAFAQSLNDAVVFADGASETVEEFGSVPETEAAQEIEAAAETEAAQETEAAAETEAAQEPETAPETEAAGEPELADEGVIVDAEAVAEETTEAAGTSDAEEEIIVDAEENVAEADSAFEDGEGDENEDETEDSSEEEESLIRLEYSSSTGTYNLLPTNNLTINTKVISTKDNPEGEEIYAYILEAKVETEETGVTCQIDESQHNVIITAGSDPEEVCINLTAYAVDKETGDKVAGSDGNGNVLASASVYINVANSYYVLESADLDNIPVGSELDVTTLGLTLKQYTSADSNGTTISKNVAYRIEKYAENCWTAVDVDETSGVVTKLRRTSPEGGGILVYAGITNDSGDWEYAAEQDYYFDGLNYSVEIKGLREDGWTYVYNDEDNYMLSVNTDTQNKLSNEETTYTEEITYTWVPYIYNSEGDSTTDTEMPGVFTVSEESPSSVTIDCAALRKAYEEELGDPEGKSKWYGLWLKVYVNGYEAYRSAFDVKAYESKYGYEDCFKNQTILIDDDFWIGAEQSCYIENGDNLDGKENVPFTVIGVKITDDKGNALTDDDGTAVDSDIIRVDEMDNNGNTGWLVSGDQVGEAYVTISYMPYDATDDEISAGTNALTKTIKVDVTGDTYRLEYDDSADSELMLPGAEKTLTLHLYHSWRHSDEDQDEEEIKEYTLDFDGEESEAYDTDLIKAVIGEDTDGYKTVTVTANSEYDDTNINLCAMINGEQVASKSPYVKVTEDYYHLDLSGIKDVLVGQTLNLTDLVEDGTIKVQHYVNGQEVGTVDGAVFSVCSMEGFVLTSESAQPDDNGITLIGSKTEEDTDSDTEEDTDSDLEGDADSESQKDCILMRTSTNDGKITISALLPQEGTEPKDLDENTCDFDSLDYSVSFKDNEDGRYNGTSYYVFDNEESYTITLDESNLTDKSDNAFVEWEVGISEDEDFEEYTLSDTDTAAKKFWEIDETAGTVKIYSEKLTAAENDLESEQSFEIRAAVYAGGSSENDGIKVSLAKCEVHVEKHRWEVQEGELPQAPSGGAILTTETFHIDRTLKVYRKDATYATGKIVEIKTGLYGAADGATVDSCGLPGIAVLEGQQDPGCTATLDEDGLGWTITPTTTGAVTISVCYNNEEGVRIVYPIVLYVFENTYQLVVDPDEVTMVTGETKTLSTYVVHNYVDADGTHTEKIETGYTLASTKDENNNVSYNTELISVTSDGTTLKVEALGEATENPENVSLYADLNSETNQYAYGSVAVTVCDSRFEVTSDSVGNPRCGEDLALIGNYNLGGMYYTSDDTDGTKIEISNSNYQFSLENLDSACWKIKSGDDAAPVPALTRISTKATTLTVVLKKYKKDKYGNESWDEVARKEYSFPEATGHFGPKTDEVSATCTTAGTKAYWTCNGCGKKFSNEAMTTEISDPETISATGHNWNEGVVTKDATCTAEGVKTYTCTNTGCSETKTETIAKTAHTMTTVIDKEATCGVAGSQHNECSVCGGEKTASVEIPATGHTSDGGKVTTEATCGAAGVKTTKCSVCGEVLATEAIPATGEHTWDAGTVTTEPTVEAAGVRTYTCTVCKTTKTEEIAKLTPTAAPTAAPTAVPTTAPTATPTPAHTTHTWGAWAITKSATVLAKGEKQRTCTVCGEVETQEIAKKKASACILLAQGKQSGKNIKLTWLKYKDTSGTAADGYEVYGTTCGDGSKYKLLKSTKSRSYTATNLKDGVAYKFYVKAYKKVNGKKVYMAQSPNIHVAMSGDKATNVKKISVKKSKITLAAGKTYTLKPTVTKQNKKKKVLKHVAEYRYYSTDTAIAKVNSKGKITAVAGGTCKIYIVANSGLWKTVTVTVK